MEISNNPDSAEDQVLYCVDVTGSYNVEAKHYIFNHSRITGDFYHSFNFKKKDLSPDIIPQKIYYVIKDSNENIIIDIFYLQDLGGVNERIRYYNGSDFIEYYFDVEETWHKVEIYGYTSNSTWDFYLDGITINKNLNFYSPWSAGWLNYILIKSNEEIRMYFDDFSFESLEIPFVINDKEYPLYSYNFENEYVTNLNENITFAFDFTKTYGSDSQYEITYDLNNSEYGDKKLQGYREEGSASIIKHKIYNYTKFLTDFSYSFYFCQEPLLQGTEQLTRFTIENNYGFAISSIMFIANSTWRGFDILSTEGDIRVVYYFNDNEYYHVKIYQYISRDIYYVFINDNLIYIAETEDMYYGKYIGYFTIDNIVTDAEYFFWFDDFAIYSLVPPLFFYTINPTLIESMIYMFIVFFILYIPILVTSNMDIEDNIKEKINVLAIFFMGIILVSTGLIALWNMLVLVICFIMIGIEEVNS